MVMEDVFNSDDLVKFYIGILLFVCFMLFVNILLFYVENMKYWDKNKCQLLNYQKNLDLKKFGCKCFFQISEEFVFVLMRLKLGFIERYFVDIFFVIKSIVS